MYGGWELHAHDVDDDVVTEPETVGMQTVPTSLDSAISHPDALNHETW